MSRPCLCGNCKDCWWLWDRHNSQPDCPNCVCGVEQGLEGEPLGWCRTCGGSGHLPPERLYPFIPF